MGFSGSFSDDPVQGGEIRDKFPLHRLEGNGCEEKSENLHPLPAYCNKNRVSRQQISQSRQRDGTYRLQPASSFPHLRKNRWTETLPIPAGKENGISISRFSPGCRRNLSGFPLSTTAFLQVPDGSKRSCPVHRGFPCATAPCRHCSGTTKIRCRYPEIVFLQGGTTKKSASVGGGMGGRQPSLSSRTIHSRSFLISFWANSTRCTWRSRRFPSANCISHP